MSGLDTTIDWSAISNSLEIKQIIADHLLKLDLNILNHAIKDILLARSVFFDNLLCHLWQKHFLEETTVSLNAVGGYGRQTLHPFSDIDICILHQQPLSIELQNNVSNFITQLWDIGVELGHGVLSVEKALELCKKDVTHATSMLEIRPLCGSKHHSQSILQALQGSQIYTSKNFFLAKLDEQQKRHNKSDTFHLEPNLKNDPGGLRDIQTLNWVAKKHFGTNNINSSQPFGFFNSDEYSELMECQNFLWRVRWALQMATQRNENRLLIEDQPEVAKQMGFGGDNTTAIEKMMRQLFRASSRIRELNQMVLAHLQKLILSPDSSKHIQSINEQFELQDGFIQARYDDVFIERKQIIIMFRIIAEHDEQVKGIAPHTLRLLRQVRRRLLGDLQDFQACRKEFVALFRHPKGMGQAISLMHQYGLLAAYLPQWREIVGQMQFDLFHAYTVDEHTHKVLKNLYRFEQQGEDKSIRLAGNLYRSIANKDTLLFAALFHDLAKGRGGDHSKLGAVDAAYFCRFHGLKSSQEKTVSWLVENHLLMSITAQRMDIYNPEIVNNFAKIVKTEARLDLLYCLTIADIQATNNKLWNDWRASLLSDLLHACRRALRSGLENMLELRSLIRERRSEAKEILMEKLPQLDDHGLKILWKQMPISFFSNAEANDIARYTAAIFHYHNAGQDTPLLLLENTVNKGSSDLFVYTKDKFGLFVSLFNALAGLKISVKQAQISHTRYGYVVETLKILDYNDEPLYSQQRQTQVIKRLQQVLAGKTISYRSKTKRQHKAFKSSPKIEFLQSRSVKRTLLNISALETTEFMSHVANTFKTMALNIHSARINTLGEKTDNVFSVSNQEGSALTITEQEKLVQLLINNIS